MSNQDENTNQGATGQGTAPEERGAGRLGRTLRWGAIAIGGPIAAIIVGIAVFVAIGIPIDLSWLRDRIEVAATDALDRKVAIEGPIELVPAIWPTLQVEGVHVGNPSGWPEADLVRLDLARTQLGILPLLQGKVQIEEVTVKGLTVSLETNAADEPNWLMTDKDEAPKPEEGPASTALQFIELRELTLADIAITYRDGGTQETYELRLNEITGNARDEELMQLFVQGAVQKVPYAVTLTAGSLATLLSGEEPWQFDLSAAAVGTNFTVTGDIAEPLLGRGLDLDFVLKGPQMRELEVILGMKLAPIRSFNLRGRITEAEGAYRVTDLQGTLGGTEFSSEFGIDTSGERPKLGGAIDVATIDVGPLIAALDELEKSRAENVAPAEKAEMEPELETAQPTEDDAPIDIDEAILVLDPLQNFDADFALTIGEIVNAPVAISDASLKVSVQNGKLTGPAKATVAEVPFSGEVRLAPEAGKPAASISLSAARSDIGELLLLMANAEGIEGSFESANLAISARGESIRSLVETTELRFSIGGAALTYGNAEGEEPVEFTLDNLDMVVPATDDSRITAKGTLLKEPFALEISGGTFMENYVEQRWPVDLAATGGGAEVRVKGELGRAEEIAGAGFDFSLGGAQIGGLSRWVSVSPDAKSSYVLRGAVTLTEGDFRARIDEGRIGKSGFKGKVGVKIEDETPVTILELAFGTIDPKALAGLLPEKSEEESRESDQEAFTIDVPILPRGIALIDSSIALTVDRIKVRPKDITKVSFTAEIRDGRVEKAPISVGVANATLSGSISTDLQGEIPMFDLDLHSSKLDVGALLSQLGVIEGLEVTAGGFDLALAIRGTSIRRMLQLSEFSAGMRDGLWRLRDPNTDGSLDIGIPKGTIESRVGKPIVLALDGRIDQTPVAIAIQTDSLASFAEPKKSLGASLDVKLLNAQLKFSGKTPLPVQPHNLRFELDYSGQRFSDFDELLKVSLPPLGPYKVAGAFGSRKSGYYIENLQLGVGSSTLTGKLELDTTQTPPRLQADFVAPAIQLDDFDAGEWSPSEGADEETETSEEDVRPGEEIREVLSPEVMRSLDGTVTVNVEKVLSGEDRLGNGTLVANLKNGRLTIEPISVDVPGGSVNVGFALEPTETDVAMEARAEVDGLDYGLLARRIDPESTTGGLISVDVDVTTRGPTLEQVMVGANGHIDFAVWPKDLNAGLFDLWAVNLFTAILPSLDSEASNVNCVVGRFTLEDGIMRPTALLADTSRIQASGDGTVDFKANTIDFRAAPKSKSPQFFSAQTPIEIKGKLEDFEVQLPPGAVVGSVVRVVTSPLVVPFQWLFTKNEPPDGVVACQKAWGRAADATPIEPVRGLDKQAEDTRR